MQLYIISAVCTDDVYNGASIYVCKSREELLKRFSYRILNEDLNIEDSEETELIKEATEFMQTASVKELLERICDNEDDEDVFYSYLIYEI